MTIFYKGESLDTIKTSLRIKANEVSKAIKPGANYESGYWAGLKYAENMIDNTPVEEYRPAITGEWIDEIGDKSIAKCPFCEERRDVISEVNTDDWGCDRTPDNIWNQFISDNTYCRLCGAEMKQDAYAKWK